MVNSKKNDGVRLQPLSFKLMMMQKIWRNQWSQRTKAPTLSSRTFSGKQFHKHAAFIPISLLYLLQSKKISNDQELIQFTKGSRGKPNEQLFPK